MWHLWYVKQEQLHPNVTTSHSINIYDPLLHREMYNFFHPFSFISIRDSLGFAILGDTIIVEMSYNMNILKGGMITIIFMSIKYKKIYFPKIIKKWLFLAPLFEWNKTFINSHPSHVCIYVYRPSKCNNSIVLTTEKVKSVHNHRVWRDRITFKSL